MSRDGQSAKRHPPTAVRLAPNFKAKLCRSLGEQSLIYCALKPLSKARRTTLQLENIFCGAQKMAEGLQFMPTAQLFKKHIHLDFRETQSDCERGREREGRRRGNSLVLFLFQIEMKFLLENQRS